MMFWLSRLLCGLGRKEAMALKGKSKDRVISPLGDVKITQPFPDFSEFFPASGSVADAIVIGSAEGMLDFSTPEDPTGEHLAKWLERVSGRIDLELGKFSADRDAPATGEPPKASAPEHDLDP
jgi:hypothetical protein